LLSVAYNDTYLVRAFFDNGAEGICYTERSPNCWWYKCLLTVGEVYSLSLH